MYEVFDTSLEWFQNVVWPDWPDRFLSTSGRPHAWAAGFRWVGKYTARTGKVSRTGQVDIDRGVQIRRWIWIWIWIWIWYWIRTQEIGLNWV